MRPEKMRKAMIGIHVLLNGRTKFRVGDWLETKKDAEVGDFVYVYPPYMGASVGPDRRYHQQITRGNLFAGLANMRTRGLSFAVSYYGATGDRSYGQPLPSGLGLAQIMLNTGVSAQTTLVGRREKPLKAFTLRQT